MYAQVVDDSSRHAETSDPLAGKLCQSLLTTKTVAPPRQILGPTRPGHRPAAGPPAPVAGSDDAPRRGHRSPLSRGRPPRRREPAAGGPAAAWWPRPGPPGCPLAGHAPARPSTRGADTARDPARHGPAAWQSPK